MGNTKSSTPTGILLHKSTNGNSNQENDNSQSLAMMAVAQKIYLKKVHILMLRYSMAKLSDEFGMIKREGFERAVDRAKLSSFGIFDKLFTMWDNDESGKVSYREFCTGISPLACPSDDLSTTLRFALRVNPNRNRVDWQELHELLTGINSTASYFGDSNLLSAEIDEIVEAVFMDEEVITHEECAKLLSINPYVVRFASGKARSNVRFREILEKNYIFDKEKLVTEYIVDDIHTLIAAASRSNDKIEPSLSREKNNYNDDAPSEGLVDVSLSDNDYDHDFSASARYNDENSRIFGNSMANSGRGYPPLIRKYSHRTSSMHSHAASSPSVSMTSEPPSRTTIQYSQRLQYQHEREY